MMFLDAAGDRELRLLGALCRALAEAGVTRVELRDAIPRLAVRASTGALVEVRIDVTGVYFVWGASGRRHPIADVPGAASELVTFMHSFDGPSPAGDAV